MKVVQTPSGRVGPLPAPVVTIGNFDGVHLGHQSILAALRQRADALHGTAVVVTFDPHPQKVLHPDAAPLLIATPAQKERWLAAAGVDHLLIVPFTAALAALEPADFVDQVLLADLDVRAVHVGRNFRFGRGRSGDVATLEDLGRRRGFHAEAVPGVRLQGARISSSRVREALGRGDVELAARLLGREEEIEGVVVAGDGRGRTLGVPTANLRADNELVPRAGVYATRLVLDGRALPAVTNIGTRPTFPGAGAATETHVLDFDGDLVGRSVALRFRARLRDERRFDTPADLVRQIRDDVAAARVLHA